MMNVAVVGHVDHQLVQEVIANPAVENRDELLEIRAVDVV